MHFDGSNIHTNLGAGIVLSSPKGEQLKYALHILFSALNNVAEYDALVHGLWLAMEIGNQRILCFGNTDLVVQKSLANGTPETPTWPATASSSSNSPAPSSFVSTIMSPEHTMRQRTLW